MLVHTQLLGEAKIAFFLITRENAPFQSDATKYIYNNNFKSKSLMATPFIDFRPAEIRENKETYILYYVLDPASDKLKRMRG